VEGGWRHLQRLCRIHGVHVGNEPQGPPSRRCLRRHARPCVHVLHLTRHHIGCILQSRVNEQRAQVTATDADRHHVLSRGKFAVGVRVRCALCRVADASKQRRRFERNESGGGGGRRTVRGWPVMPTCPVAPREPERTAEANCSMRLNTACTAGTTFTPSTSIVSPLPPHHPRVRVTSAAWQLIPL
jgi:hypothetical protein